MKLSIGIVGLPNVGKSTLFQTITKKQVDIQNYPFCTIEPNVGVVFVPDERLEKLALFSHSAKIIPAVVEFVDIAGLVKGANQGEGLGNKFLSHIREVDAIIYVLRAFKNPNIINVSNNIDPIAEKEILDTELMLKDLETVNKRIGSLEKEKKSRLKEAMIEYDIFMKLKLGLEAGKQIRDLELDTDEQNIIKQYQFLTNKSCLYVLNGKDEEVDTSIIDYFVNNKLDYLIIDIKTEFDIADLNEEERSLMGITSKPELDLLIQKAYTILNLISFFTTGKDETRAWTIVRGTKAPQAAGVIHGDFEKYFIRADVISWDKLLEALSWERAKSLGIVRSEGKEYIVQDGDVLEIKHGLPTD